MNPRLNKKVKKDLDAYFKGTSASSPEAHHAIMFILKGALTDANFHSTSKKVDKLFPKAKGAKYFGKREWEDNLETKGYDIAAAAKWDGDDILDAIGFFISMYIGGPLGKKIEALKNESLNRESNLLENLSVLVEKNVPTNPSKWSYYKSQAKKKFDVYPSAYANAWAAKQYKAAGGGWRTTKESIEEGAYTIMNVNRTVSNTKKKLMKKWKQKGGYENFGQKELDILKKKLDYNPYGSDEERKIAKILDNFDNWAMNYDGNMRESVINEISAEGGLKRVIKGQTREVEGIKVSKEMAQAMLDWFNSSPYGRKYPKAKKARLHLSLGIMSVMGLDRYAKHKGAKDELKYIKTLAKAMREDNSLRESTINHLQFLKESKDALKDNEEKAVAKVMQKVIGSDIEVNGDDVKYHTGTSTFYAGNGGETQLFVGYYEDEDKPYNVSIEDGSKQYAQVDAKTFKDVLKAVASVSKKYKKNLLESKKSVNEILTIVDKFDAKKQDYDKMYYKDGGDSPGDGDLKKAKKELAKLSKKHKGLTLVSVGRNSKMYDVMKADESVNEGVFSNKQDAMNAYMNGKISAEKLDKIAKTYFKSSVATKQELQNFMKSGYMKELMANTYGLKVPAMEKKVKELMKYAS